MEEKNREKLLEEIEHLRDRVDELEKLQADWEETKETLWLTQFSVNRASDAIFWIDPAGLFIYVNEQACRGLGYSREELLTMHVFDIDPNYPQKEWKRHWAEVKRKQYFILETAHRAKDGKVFPVEISVNYLTFHGKEYNYAFARDITERKKAEADIRELLDNLEIRVQKRTFELARINVSLQEEINERKKLEQQMEFILGATKTGLDIIDADYNMIYVDPGWQKIYGDPQGKKCYEYFMERHSTCPECGVRKALQTKKTVVSEEILVKEGNRPVQVTTIPFKDENGDWFVAEINVDMTERKKIEENLKQAKEKAELIYKITPSAIFTVDKKCRIISWNNMTAKITGYSAEEAIGKECFFFREHACKDECVLANKEIKMPAIGRESVIKRKDGRKCIILENLDILKDSDGNMTGGIVSFEDITKLKDIEAALKESEEKFKSVVDNIAIGVTLISPAMEVLALNRQMRTWFPGIDVNKKPICYRSFNIPPKDGICSYCPTCKTLKDGKVYETITETPAGKKTINFRIVSSPIKGIDDSVIAAVEVVEDVTNRKNNK